MTTTTTNNTSSSDHDSSSSADSTPTLREAAKAAVAEWLTHGFTATLDEALGDLEEALDLAAEASQTAGAVSLETLARVLAEHVAYLGACQCGWTPACGMTATLETWAEHVAAAVLRALDLP